MGVLRPDLKRGRLCRRIAWAFAVAVGFAWVALYPVWNRLHDTRYEYYSDRIVRLFDGKLVNESPG